jgi:hypothetical protein
VVSAAEQHEGQQLVGEVGGGDAGHLGMVVGGRWRRADRWSATARTGTEKWLTSETSDLRELASQVLGTVLL